MKDYFKIGLEDEQGSAMEGHDKSYVKNAGWWLIHRPVHWFCWLGFVFYMIPMTIENTYWTWKQGKQNKDDKPNN